MTELEFQSLANEGFNRIPLIAEALADLETPLSLYLKLAQTERNGANSFLLESVVGGERFGRYSFIGLPARTMIRVQNGVSEVLTDGKVIETSEADPLGFIEEFQKRFKIAQRPGLPRFCGGLAGYFGYDAVRYIEKKLAHTAPRDDLGLPDIQLLLTEEMAVIDNLAGKLYLIVYADPTAPEAFTKAKQRLRELRARLRTTVQPPVTSASVRTETYREFAKDDYLNAVRKAKEYIAAGELMQVQVGQRLIKPFRDNPLSLYRALRSLNPSPYMYYYNFGGEFHVVGASPEILVRQEKRGDERIVTIRPLAGTRPRGNTPERDAELAIEKYSHVQHIVSSVEGKLKPGTTNFDVLRATFPAGTLSGAPKVRAMEIIDELEQVKRGIYGGAVGYLSFAGDMDLAIAIRTGIIKNNVLYVQAAAGIVADSVPESEWKETEAKARAVLRAAEQVEDGFESD